MTTEKKKNVSFLMKHVVFSRLILVYQRVKILHEDLAQAGDSTPQHLNLGPRVQRCQAETMSARSLHIECS